MSPQNGKNKSALPADVEKDGEFLKPLPIEGYFDPQKSWYAGLNPWQRLNSHYTYSSVRRNVYFKPFRTIHDHLDLAIRTTYVHGKETFPEPVDVLFQPLTLGIGPKYSGLKDRGGNKRKFSSFSSDFEKPHFPSFSDKPQDKLNLSPKSCPLRRLSYMRQLIKSKQLLPNHPLVIGGIKEKVHPSYVKLMNSSHHSPLTNAGYVRQDRDGTMFYY